MTADPSQGYRVRDAARLWPCSVRTLYRLIDQKLVATYRQTPNGPLCITRAELERARAAMGQQAAASTVGMPVDEALAFYRRQREARTRNAA